MKVILGTDKSNDILNTLMYEYAINNIRFVRCVYSFIIKFLVCIDFIILTAIYKKN